MVRDIYTRQPGDNKYVYGEYEFSDPIESIITKIRMILGTSQGQVLSDMNFGIGLEDLVFETKLNKFDLEERITQQIYTYIYEAAEYKIKPQVQFGRSDKGFDYCLIDIFINEIKAVGILVD
jgi:hypothetical protein